MADYDFKCRNRECGFRTVVSIPVDKFCSGDFTPPVCEKCGSGMFRLIAQAPPVHLKGLGFYSTDKEYEEQLKIAEEIADKAYYYRAKKSVEEDPISQDDDFWNELCSQDFAKEKKRREYFTPSGPPSTVIPEYEEKASTTIAKAGTPTRWADSN